MSARIGLLALALMASSGCAAQKAKESTKALRDAVNGYNTAFRWKNYHQAASYLPNDLRTAFVSYFDEESSSLHIEAVEVLKVDMSAEDEATVTVRYRYMLLPSVVVDRKVVKQTWKRSDDAWVLDDEDPPLVDYESGPPAKEPEPDEGWTTPDTWNREG